MADDAIERGVKLLRDHGLKVTPQRLEILRYLEKYRNHPTADEIYNALKKRNPSLSKTTVYNTLETMHKQRLVDVLTISESERRYDLRRESHHHFMCQECGQILDIEIACPNCHRIIDGEHRVDEVHGYFKGVCSECLTKDDKKTMREK